MTRQIALVDLRIELQNRNFSIFSWRLEQAITDTLARGEQVILFLNRRGSASSILCRQCGHVMRCQHCDISLTWHEHSEEKNNHLACHYCGRLYPPPTACPNCQSAFIKFIGIGTEKVEKITRTLWPQARVARLDADTTRHRHTYDQIYRSFAEHQTDILIGTQLVTKGLDLPNVTLAGVLLADLSLSLPDFRAPERTFSQLLQVAGRTGRRGQDGLTIIQTYNPEHYALQALVNNNYQEFYTQEIKHRADWSYPPFSRLIKLVQVDTNPLRQTKVVEKTLAQLTQKKETLALNVEIISVKPLHQRLNNLFYHLIILKGDRPEQLLTPDLTDFRIDIDPQNLNSP